MEDSTQHGVTCCICGGATVDDMPDYRGLRRVTSDCRPWPSGGCVGSCRDCGAVQKPADEKFLAEIDDIYRSYAIYHQAAGAEQAIFEQVSGLPASRSVRLLDTFRRSNALKPVGRMLDVGCGNGATIRAFGQIAPGWVKTGTEFDAKYRSEVESIPNTEPLHVGPFTAVRGTFDVITMVHVLEHMVSPVDALTDLRPKLADGGLLLIEVPHHLANPFELLIADHRTHFTADSLARALARAGYEVVSLADNWIPKELSAVARPAAGGSAVLPAIDPFAARKQVFTSIRWLVDAAARLRALAAQGPVGLFGTSIAGTWLAAEADDVVEFFVDEDPARAGRSYRGRPVYAPADVPAGSRVFVGLPPAVAEGICNRLARRDVSFLSPGRATA
jgi:SAM-dependent methyltransferase